MNPITSYNGGLLSSLPIKIKILSALAKIS